MHRSLITRAEDLSPIIARLRADRFVALDTEFVWTSTYFPNLGVVQLGAADGSAWVVDAAAIHPALADLIADPDTVKILHDARQDLALLREATGASPRNVFDTRLAAGVHIGNFVETKKTTIGPGSKVNHLTYLGDAEVGAEVNVGAGTITCNYDGANKHKTVIEDGAFIGSNSSLVAPVRIGKGATIGAGSSVSRSVPDGSLCLTRAQRKEVAHWTRPVKPKNR